MCKVVVKINEESPIWLQKAFQLHRIPTLCSLYTAIVHFLPRVSTILLIYKWRGKGRQEEDCKKVKMYVNNEGFKISNKKNIKKLVL